MKHELNRAGSTHLQVGVWKLPDMSHDLYVKFVHMTTYLVMITSAWGVWKRALHYVVQS